MLRRKFKKIVDFFNKMLGGEDIDSIQEIRKCKMSNLINNVFPNVFNNLMTDPSDEVIEWYKSYFGRVPSTKEDLQAIPKEREKQLKIYNQLFPEIVEDENKEAFDFDEFVNGLEITNSTPINRKDRLYTLGSHYKSAVQINQLRKNTSDGRN